MGTRSETSIMQDGKELCRVYRQFDGYPSGHGADLAKLCNVQIVNGYNFTMKAGTHANGMGCLAAQVIQGLKAEKGIGGIYLQVPEGDYGDWSEYIYVVTGAEGSVPAIECKRPDGAVVFPATPADQLTDEFLSKF